jgi:aminoglycoside phosphotransferase (APT) family kinase protein
VCTAEGFLNRADLAQRYGEVSGRDISQLDYYVAFAYWKLACIIEGVYARYLGGALGDRDPAELEPFKLQVDGAAQKAASMLEKLR